MLSAIKLAKMLAEASVQRSAQRSVTASVLGLVIPLVQCWGVNSEEVSARTRAPDWVVPSDLRSAVHSELGWAVRSVESMGSLWADASALCWE